MQYNRSSISSSIGSISSSIGSNLSSKRDRNMKYRRMIIVGDSKYKYSRIIT